LKKGCTIFKEHVFFNIWFNTVSRAICHCVSVHPRTTKTHGIENNEKYNAISQGNMKIQRQACLGIDTAFVLRNGATSIVALLREITWFLLQYYIRNIQTSSAMFLIQQFHSNSKSIQSEKKIGIFACQSFFDINIITESTVKTSSWKNKYEREQ